MLIIMSTFSGWTDDAPGLVEPLEQNIMATSCLASLLDSLYLFNMSVCGGGGGTLQSGRFIRTTIIMTWETQGRLELALY